MQIYEVFGMSYFGFIWNWYKGFSWEAIDALATLPELL